MVYSLTAISQMISVLFNDIHQFFLFVDAAEVGIGFLRRFDTLFFNPII
jgi:hypothetical protein